jgi:hypothetical protein
MVLTENNGSHSEFGPILLRLAPTSCLPHRYFNRTLMPPSTLHYPPSPGNSKLFHTSSLLCFSFPLPNML